MRSASQLASFLCQKLQCANLGSSVNLSLMLYEFTNLDRILGGPHSTGKL